MTIDGIRKRVAHLKKLEDYGMLLTPDLLHVRHLLEMVDALAGKLALSKEFPHPPAVTPSREQCDPILCSECWLEWADRQARE